MPGYIYHTGFLARDRDPSFSNLGKKRAIEIGKSANTVAGLYYLGLAVMAQRWRDFDVYEYIVFTSDEISESRIKSLPGIKPYIAEGEMVFGGINVKMPTMPKPKSDRFHNSSGGNRRRVK